MAREPSSAVFRIGLRHLVVARFASGVLLSNRSLISFSSAVRSTSAGSRTVAWYWNFFGLVSLLLGRVAVKSEAYMSRPAGRIRLPLFSDLKDFLRLAGTTTVDILFSFFKTK